MTFIYDDEAVITGIVDIYRLCYRHNIGLQVIALSILIPHILQVGRTDDKCTAGVSHFVNLGNGACCDGFSQSYHIAYHGTTALIAIQMAGRYLDCCLLKIEEFPLKLWWQCEFLYTTTGICTQMVGRLQVDIIRWDDFLAGPTVVDGINQFFSDVDAETVVPTVIKPLGQCFKVSVVFNIGIEFPLLGQSCVGQIATAKYGGNFIAVGVGIVSQVEFCM